MYIDVAFIKQQLNQRKVTPNIEASVGTLLKYYRKKRNMTLSESADDICSVSYLSKVENNALIPSDKYVKRLKQRFDIVEEASYDFKIMMDEVIDRLFYQVETKSLILSTSCDAKSLLLRFAYAIFNHDLDNAYQSYLDSVYFIKNYNHVEISLYLYCVSHLLVHQGMFDQAFVILTKIENFADHKVYLKSLIEHQQLIVAFETNNYPYLMSNYTKLKEKMLQQGAYHLVKKMKKAYYEYMAMYHDIETLRLDIEIDMQHDPVFVKYLTALRYYQKAEFDKVVTTLLPYSNEDETYRVWVLKALSKLDDCVQLANLIDQSQHIISHDYVQLLTYLRIKALSPETVVEFLRDEVIHNKMLYDRYHMMMYWYEEIMLKFKMLNFYKESTLFAQKVILRMNKKRNIGIEYDRV